MPAPRPQHRAAGSRRASVRTHILVAENAARSGQPERAQAKIIHLPVDGSAVCHAEDSTGIGRTFRSEVAMAQRGRSQVSLLDLINAGLIQPGQVLRFNGRQGVQARVTSNGKILYQGIEYNSLSAAAAPLSRSAVNGWVTWRVKSRDGRWVTISKLRQALLQTADS